MGNLEPKRPRAPVPFPGSPEAPKKPENLVAEIVDQITEKQARAPRPAPVEPDPAAGCSACLESAVTGTPYLAVLHCATEDPGTS